MVTNGSTTDQGSSYSKRYSHAQNQTRSSILRRNFRTGQPKLAALQRHARLQHARGNSEPSKKQCSPPKFSFESLSDRFEEWAEEPFFKRNSLNGSAVEGLWACLLVVKAVARSGLSGEPTSEVHRYLVCKILRIYSFITNSPPDQKKNHGRAPSKVHLVGTVGR